MRIGFGSLPLWIVLVAQAATVRGFQSVSAPVCRSNERVTTTRISATKGFGGGSGNNSRGKKKKKSKNRLRDTLHDKPSAKAKSQSPSQSKDASPESSAQHKPYVKNEQNALLEQLATRAANTPVGRAVIEFAPVNDPFWDLMPSLLSSRFPEAADADMHRVAGFCRHALALLQLPDDGSDAGVSSLPPPDDWIEDPHRPWEELHAYMPGLGHTRNFYDPDVLPVCQLLSDHCDVITDEYHALLDYSEKNEHSLFQSVTSMNYDSGWTTLVLFYNGHRIPNFPYHLCPVTTRIMESLPLAGRIAGFNRQQPGTGIPRHTDGNNMWLTCQMGLHVPDPIDDASGAAARITVGDETRSWQRGLCLVYDTTYQHETINDSPTQERVVLHVDFFNTLALTPVEIDVMQYVYSLREEFMKAEGVDKVGAHVL